MKKQRGNIPRCFYKGENGAPAKGENGTLAKRGEWRPAPACYSLPTFFSTGRQISI